MPGHAWANSSILDHYRRLAVATFPELDACPHEFFASMSLYARAIPWKFFNRTVAAKAFQLLRDVRAGDERWLLSFFNDRHGEIEVAMRSLDEINRSPFHDAVWWSAGEPADVRELRQIHHIRDLIHPGYLQLCEGVLKTLLHPIAVFERRRRGNASETFTPDQRIEEARRAGLDAFDSFDSRLRNAIAHGSVRFSKDEIEYRDAHGKGVKTRSTTPTETLQMFEDLLDICNGLAAAFRLLVVLDAKLLFSETARIPPGLLFAEVQHQLNTAGWHVHDYLEFEYDSKRDLNLFVETSYFDDRKTQLAVIRAAVVAARFMPTFDRCNVQLQRRGRMGGWGLFEIPKVQELLQRGVTEAAPYLAAAPEMGFMVFPLFRHFRVGHPLRVIGSIVEVFRTSWPTVRSRIPRSQVRHARIVSKKTYSFVTAATVLHVDDLKTAMKFVVTNLRSILRDAIRAARHEPTTSRSLRWLPIGYVEVDVHRSDRRRRQLLSSGLNANLLCRIVRKTRGQIEVLPLHESVPQQIGKVIIFWNRAAVEPLLSNLD
jgi:hypothetical protein